MLTKLDIFNYAYILYYVNIYLLLLRLFATCAKEHCSIFRESLFWEEIYYNSAHLKVVLFYTFALNNTSLPQVTCSSQSSKNNFSQNIANLKQAHSIFNVYTEQLLLPPTTNNKNPWKHEYANVLRLIYVMIPALTSNLDEKDSHVGGKKSTEQGFQIQSFSAVYVFEKAAEGHHPSLNITSNILIIRLSQYS